MQCRVIIHAFASVGCYVFSRCTEFVHGSVHVDVVVEALKRVPVVGPCVLNSSTKSPIGSKRVEKTKIGVGRQAMTGWVGIEVALLTRSI